MKSRPISIDPMPPAITRLSALARLDEASIAALELAIQQQESISARRELVTEGRPVPAAKLLLGGWAARVRILLDGRRQFLSFVLPGDLIGLCEQRAPLAVSTVAALSDCTICIAPSAGDLPMLRQAYAVSRALDEAYLLAQITRLGRLNAQERIGDLLLELFERQILAGIVRDNAFDFPLTQEMLADALGLTSVHLNRTIQTMRRDRDLMWQRGILKLLHPAALTRKTGRVAARVTGDLA